MPSSCLCSRWVPIQLDSFICSKACFYSTGETESGPDGSFAQLASVLHVFLFCEGTAREKSFRSLMTTSIQVLLSSIILPSSRASNVCSHFPPSALLSRALGTPRSRRLGSALFKACVDVAEPSSCVQETTMEDTYLSATGSPRISG